jgi:hypothetical protein
MFAVTEAFWVAAAAGSAPHSADQAAASANIPALVAIARPAACRRETGLSPEWLIFGQPRLANR